MLKALTHRTGFAYLSAVAIIIILITCSQIAIQLTLFQETSTRNLAVTMSVQLLRTQRILRSSLLLLVPTTSSLNSLHVSPRTQLQGDLLYVEHTNTQLEANGTPAYIATQIKALHADFVAMDSAGHKELADDPVKSKKDMLTQAAAIFLHEQRYLQGVYNAYILLTQQADQLVQRVQIVEIVIYILSLGVIAYEVFVVVLPAERDRRKENEELKLRLGDALTKINMQPSSGDATTP